MPNAGASIYIYKKQMERTGDRVRIKAMCSTTKGKNRGHNQRNQHLRARLYKGKGGRAEVPARRDTFRHPRTPACHTQFPTLFGPPSRKVLSIDVARVPCPRCAEQQPRTQDTIQHGHVMLEVFETDGSRGTVGIEINDVVCHLSTRLIDLL